ncbi:MAG: hypothetical protein ACYCZ0_02660 [Minisyncoccota bacterium]
MIILISNLGARAVEYVAVAVTYQSGLASSISQLPTTREFIQVQLLAWEVAVLLVALGSIGNAYRYYLILYPRFVRGGRDAIALYMLRASHHKGCPAAGCKVAVERSLHRANQ